MAIPLERDAFTYFPDIDTTVIHLKRPITDAPKIELQHSSHIIGDEIYSIGHIGRNMPMVNAAWEDNRLVIHDYHIQECDKSDKLGTINAIKTATVNSIDVKFTNIIVIKPSFPAIEGMSGGPLINKKNDQLVGLMSFGLPANMSKKNEVFAIDVNEIIRAFNAVNMDY